jgi:hypothetical protein
MANSKDTAASTSAQEEEKTKPQPPKDIVIIEEGDVLLVCRDADSRGKFLVSSVILKHTSSVFKAMLGPHFAEGQTPRSAQHPQEVHCPEDCWAGMQLLCKLLHNTRSFLNGTLPGALAIAYFSEAAVLADKYNCTDSIRMQAQSVFAKYGDRLVTNEQPMGLLRDLIAAAYMLGCSNYFYIFTSGLS